MATTSQLGTNESYLGNFVLGQGGTGGGGGGGTVYDREVSHSLTLNQLIEKSLSKNVSNILVLTHKAARTAVGVASNNITLNQSITTLKIKKGIANDTLNLIQSATSAHVIIRSIFHSLIFSQQIQLTYSLHKLASNTLVCNQIPVGKASRAIGNALILNQIVVVVKSKAPKSQLELTQLISVDLTLLRNLINFFGVTSSATLNHFSNLVVSNSLIFNQATTLFKVRGVSNVLTLNQTLIGFAGKKVSNDLALNQVADFDVKYNRTINQVLILKQNVIVNRVKAAAAFDILPIDHSVQKSKLATKSLISLLNLNQEAQKGRTDHFLTHTLPLAQIANHTRIRSRIGINTLTLNHSLFKLNVFTRNLSNHLELKEYQVKTFNLGETTEITVPSAQIAVVRKYNTITAKRRTIVLPVAEFNDQYSNKSQVNVRRSMNGRVFSYVKSSDFEKVRLPLRLRKVKALELEDFINNFHSELLTFEIWRGERYLAYITNNPFEFISSARWDPDIEGVEVTVEFEGVKLI